MSTKTPIKPDDQAFIALLETAFEQSNVDFARAYYLFATAKLADTYASAEIYAKYPLLTDAATFERLKPLYDNNPGHDTLRRMYKSVLDTYVDSQLSSQNDAYENAKSQLKVDLSDLGLTTTTGEPVGEVLYEDLSEWLKRLSDKSQREAVYAKLKIAFEAHLAPLFMATFTQKQQLMADLGYADTVGFYSQMLGHPLPRLGQVAQQLLADTKALYSERVSDYYTQRTGLPFAQASRADISYVFYGPGASDPTIEAKFKADRLLAVAASTFNGLGFNFSAIAAPVNFQSREEHQAAVSRVAQPSDEPVRRIYLDVAHRPGKRSRAYVYPAKVPSEVYLSVKPEGGLDDYLAFFHESGHALHFAYGDPALSYTQALMGNNAVTEAYAYLFQNLLLNRHWLVHQVGLSPEQAKAVVNRGALNDLYMLRRYCAKLCFELVLFADSTIEGKGARYSELLTEATGFAYDAEGWRRDVDAGFYVADYFTAWTLEAQLRFVLAQRFGNPAHAGEDWYTNPQAGAFLVALWAEGNLNHDVLANKLAHAAGGDGQPNNPEALLFWMHRNLG